MRIAVLGAGAWGTALAMSFAPRHEVCLWARATAQAEQMAQQHENYRYLPGCPLPERLRVTADLDAACAAADLLLLATPVAGLRPTLVQLAPMLRAATLPLLWACKGLEAGSGLLPHQVVAAVLGDDARCGVLSGPSFAREVAHGLPTAITLAAADMDFATATAQALHGGSLRIYANGDLIGVEVGGAVKNVLAIATGISDGLELGHNARAALITRGLAEITRFGVALGARRETFMGLAGLGDLVLTCTGDLSRNRRVGLRLAAGKTPNEIAGELGHVAEGVPAAYEIARRARALGIELPITEVVVAVLEGRLAPREAVLHLMAREPKSE
ncbi:MAG: glycerol-3-phosphate dehydrogenase [Betaproteobacteria bacterium HGW-Betaproteobacteria-11]|nr:MAG: glycerol-3-phosphate dehydrogenase [Betaproteobacteria bacterium HGW-Betaproteobacteria-11]